MSIPQFVDGVTDLDAPTFNRIVDRVNGIADGTVVIGSPAIYNVLHYGAEGDGTTNDQAAIQDAIDACLEGGGGTVYFPGGRTYFVQLTTAGADQHCLTVYGYPESPITFLGGAGARLSFYTLGGHPDTNWQEGIPNFTKYRGNGLRFDGGDSYANRRAPIRVIGLEMDGNYTYVYADGEWDTSHKCISTVNADYYEWVEVRDCHLHNWGGEVVYAGGQSFGLTPFMSNYVVVNNLIHDADGSLVSVYGKRLLIAGNELYNCRAHGTECAPDSGMHLIHSNYIHDCEGDGIAEVHWGDGDSATVVHSNRLERCEDAGISIYSPAMAQVHNNVTIDCATGIRLEIGVGYPNDTARMFDIHDNTIACHGQSTSVGISLNYASSTHVTHRIYNNRIGPTKSAEDDGYAIGQPIAIYPTVNLQHVEFRDNAYKGSHGDSTNNRAVETLLTGTSQTTIASFKPSYEALLEVSVSVRVITAATNVTITVTSEDYADVATSYPVLALTSLATGSYSYGAILVPTDGRATCAVKVTAGTANQVYATAMIREV